MKKTLIALAVLGAAAGVAHAQSNVVIYGNADIGYYKESGKKMAMDEKVNNRLGFMGTEDLGGGLKATFQLEHRFTLNDGEHKKDKMFEGASNLGLAGNFGAVRFGRVNEISTETYRAIDPFNQYGVGGMFETFLRGDNGGGRLSNTVRYDSPNMSGFKAMVSYTLKAPGEVTPVADGTNQGYALGGTYNNGPLYVVANYSKMADSNDSNNWNIGAAYAFGPAKISAGYEQSKYKFADDTKDKSFIVGLSYKIGAGVINASYNQSKITANSVDYSNKDKKYALGYTHNLSKRTSVYAEIARTDYDSMASIRAIDAEATKDGVTAYAIGMTHKF